MTKDEILAALPKLTRPDLEAVHAVTNGLLAGRLSNVATPASPLAVSTFEALSAALNVTTGLHLVPSSINKRFHAQLPELASFLDANFDGWQDQKVSQQAFLRFLFNRLRDDLLTINIKPTYVSMINNFSRIPRLIEYDFPGYLSSGMGRLILKQFM